MASSDDDDIFVYTPLQRSLSQATMSSPAKPPSRLIASQQVTKNKLKRPLKKMNCNTFRPPASAPKRKKSGNNTTSVSLGTESCPICQMPWISLGLGGKREVHVVKCSLIDYSHKKVCPKGFNCQELCEKHYLSYSHELWAEARSQVSEQNQIDLFDLGSKKSPNGDSGFEDAAGANTSCNAGPSGWRPKLENTKSDIEIGKIENTSGNVSVDLFNSQNMLNDVNKYDIDDADSLPDISSYHSISQNKDTSHIEISSKYCERDKSIMRFSTSQLAKSLSSSVGDEPNETDSSVLLDVQLDDEVNDIAHADSISSGETTLYDKNFHKERGTFTTSKFTNQSLSSETNINSGGGESSLISEESQSLLQNVEASQEPLTEGILPTTSTSENPELAQQPVNDEIDSEDDDLLTKMVDEAVERYIGKSNLNTKCFHLHVHYNKTSPEKNGQKSILNYFKPLNPKTTSEEDQSKSSCCQCGTEGQDKTGTTKSGATKWKALMSKMQSKQSNSEQNISEGKGKSKQQQSTQENKFYSESNRPCPFYKYIPDTSFVVDAFSYGYLNGINVYFLSHFHYDHFRGLTKKFNKLIYCSYITAKLVNLRIGISYQYLRPLPVDVPRVINSVEVTLLDANHCPGSVMFLFKIPGCNTILHVGDFRAHPKMESYPSLWNCSIDVLYLDTTYCKPIYDFPSQDEVLEKCVSIATSHIEDNSKTLIVVGSYTIGKERVFRAIAAALDCRIWATNDKQKILRCLEDEDINSRLTSDKFNAQVHVVPMNAIHIKKLSDYVEALKPKFNVVVAIRPTGWEHNGDEVEVLENLVPKQCGNVYVYGIPYSEHSSFNELERFVKFTRPKKIIPTVNVGNEYARKEMEKQFKNWLKAV